MLNGCAYILTVDVGNTFIRFGLFAEDSAAAQECPLATCEITTPTRITADEARMRLAQVMAALAADAGMPGTLVPTAAVLRGAGARAPLEDGAFSHLYGACAHGGTGSQDRHACALR